MGSGSLSANAAAPTIGAVWASAVQPTNARLNAEVDPGGKSSTYRYDYISKATYDANVAASKDPFTGTQRLPALADTIIAGIAPTTIAPLLSGLTPDAAYRYRLVVKNADGTTTGPTRDLHTHGTAPFTLPDDRGWEMVSPVVKNGGEVEPPGALAGGGVLQAAVDGQAVTYGSGASFGGGVGAPPASQYLGSRVSGGWLTQNISLPLPSGAYPDDEGSPYRLFSADLARAVHWSAYRCAPGPCPREYLLRETATGALTASPQQPDLRLAGASPDLKYVVLSSCAVLAPGATDGCGAGDPNLYLWSGGGLSLINTTPGATLAAQGTAVSIDGSRIYFNDLASADLYLRVGAQTKQVDAAAGGGGTFETASADGTTAFFTKSSHLWRYVAGTDTATDLTPSGGVLGVLGTSVDASRAYFKDAGGLKHWSNGTTTLIAPAADASNYPPTTGTARVSADGTKLLFQSTTPLLTSDGHTYDNLDASTKAPTSQLYLFDASGPTLTCVSCNPTHARPLGPSSVPGAIANGLASTQSYKPRVMSSDGRRVFFDSEDALASTDVNAGEDVYQWQAQGKGSCAKPGGCISLISSGLANWGFFIDASLTGDDVFFITDRSLVGSDPDSVDLYDARVGGGLPEPAQPNPCTGDACQIVPPAVEDPVLTTTLQGPGNPAERYRSYGAKAKCPKGKVRKKGKCVKKGAKKKSTKAKKSGGKR